MKNLWKVISTILIPILVFVLIDDSSHMARWQIFDWIFNGAYIVGVVGLFSYSFNFKVLSKDFWRGFFIIYLLINIYNLAIELVPQKILHALSLPVGYNTNLNYYQPDYLLLAGNLFFVLPVAYSLYRLANKNTK